MRRIEDIDAACAAAGGHGCQPEPGIGGCANRARWLADHILPHESWLRYWLQRHGVHADAEDIVQESYALLMQAGSVDHVRNPRAYLCQTARSVIMRRVRRDAIIRFEPLRDLAGDRTAADLPLQDMVLAYRDDLALLRQSLDMLPQRTRAVVWLRRIEGASLRESAERLGISESAVEKHLRRAMAELRLAVDWQ